MDRNRQPDIVSDIDCCLSRRSGSESLMLTDEELEALPDDAIAAFIVIEEKLRKNANKEWMKREVLI